MANKNMLSEYLTRNVSQTKKIGKISAEEILKKNYKKKAVVIGLKGDLGGGKTSFLQGFARELGIKEKILSPTFVIMKKFKIPLLKKYDANKFFYHLDCYRILKAEEILKIDFIKKVSEPQNIIAIEWAEKIEKFLPKKIIWAEFYFINKKTRKIKFKNL